MPAKRFLFLLVCLAFLRAEAATDSLLKNITAKPDLRIDDARGIFLSIEYDLRPLLSADPLDSVLLQGEFRISTRLFVNGQPVKPATGFHAYRGEKGELIFSERLSNSEKETAYTIQTKTIFIPYAALDLPQGTSELTVEAVFSGKDGLGNTHLQRIQRSGITINKPRTYLVTMNIDHIEVLPKTASGYDWDLNILATDAPDISVSLKVGPAVVWSKSENDSYLFSVGPYSRNIRYAVSEEDKLVVRIVDLDLVFNDFIAEWHFDTKNKSLGKKNLYNKSKGVIRSVLLDFQLD